MNGQRFLAGRSVFPVSAGGSHRAHRGNSEGTEARRFALLNVLVILSVAKDLLLLFLRAPFSCLLCVLCVSGSPNTETQPVNGDTPAPGAHPA
jgi:hypothetical protein